MSATDLSLSHIAVYPLKSVQETPLAEARAERDGFFGDRRWLLTTLDGGPVMLSAHPDLTRLRATATDAGLALAADGRPDLVVPFPMDAEPIEVRVKRRPVSAVAAGPEADAWLSELLDVPVRLGYMPDDVSRAAPKAPDARIGFAGDAPYLLVCDASLAALNARLDAPVKRDRFRANLAVAGGAPWQEDGWRTLRIGEAVFEALGPCPRCPNTTVDPATGLKGAEPLRTLKEIRAVDGRAMFGVFMGVREAGRVAVGDPVEILD